jgi:pimeloyl-ACP methyl ester carboxylesterase
MRFTTIFPGLALLAQMASAQTLPDETYRHPQKLVAVDGARRLNLFCMGHGSPTVLFDSGLADSTIAWLKVQGEVAKVTRACSYDRAGVGFSDPRMGESDTKAIVADIHALLGSAKIRTPILFVGHSMAGLDALLLQATYPQDVAGAVLVDPSFADQFDASADAAIAAGALPAMRKAALDGYHKDIARLRECAALPAPLPDDCAQSDTRLSPSLAAFEKAQESRPSYLVTNASEYENMLPTADSRGVDQKELEAAAPNFGDKPLIVLTHGIAERYPGLTPTQNAAIEASWSAGHNKLAALSTRGSNTVVPDSHHSIQRDHPQAVIDAISKALAEIRGR